MNIARISIPALLLISALAVAGCKSKPTATTQPTRPPAADLNAPVPLVARLTVTPAFIRVPAGATTKPAQPATLQLTLVVTNTTSRVYTGESPDAAVARFALVHEGLPLWSYPEFAAQVVTPVTLAPGQSVTYNAAVSLPDARVFRGKVLQARASFSPAALQTMTPVPVN